MTLVLASRRSVFIGTTERTAGQLYSRCTLAFVLTFVNAVLAPRPVDRCGAGMRNRSSTLGFRCSKSWPRRYIYAATPGLWKTRRARLQGADLPRSSRRFRRLPLRVFVITCTAFSGPPFPPHMTLLECGSPRAEQFPSWLNTLTQDRL